MGVARQLPGSFKVAVKTLLSQETGILVAGLSRRKPKGFYESINNHLGHVKRYFTSSYIISSGRNLYRDNRFSGCPAVARTEKKQRASTRQSWGFFCRTHLIANY